MKPLALLALLFCCSCARAQSLPEMPEPKTPERADRRIFFVGTAALAGSKAFDLSETSGVVSIGGWENDPTFGRHPSNGRLAGVGAAEFAAETAGFYYSERNRHAWVRWTGRALIAFAVEERIRLGVCNANLWPVEQGSRNCRALIP